MKIKIPEDRSEITLGEYQKYHSIMEREDLEEIDKYKRVFSLFTGVPYSKCGDVNYNDFKDVTLIINESINREVEFKSRFILNDIEYGFINDFDEITFEELYTIGEYQNDVSNLNKLMAVLFREVESSDKKGNYTIIDFDNTFKRSEVFKDMPLNLVDGAIFFFKSLQIELKNYIQKYTQEELLKV